MYRVFLVTEGVSLVEDVPPTANVLALQSSLGRRCGVRTKDIILLSPKGHLLDSKETLGGYDAGTDEKPVFVFFRPDSLNKQSLLYTPHRTNPTIGPQLDRLSSSPSPTALQHQLGMAKVLADEANKLSNRIQELRVGTRLQCIGWQALINNFTSIHRSFEKHHRAFGWSLVNLQESRPGYEELLAKSPQQLEILKKIALSPNLGQDVFGGYNGSLYEWISSQDEHSSLPELIRECHDTLSQIDETSLTQLQLSASQLIVTADNFTKTDSVKELFKDVKMEDVTRTTQEQQSMAQSIQSTIQRVLGSGDAGALANVSLSNQRLVQLMYNNHKILEALLQELEIVRRSIKEMVETRLKPVAELQQQLIETNSRLLFYSEHLQLTRRRFEVLEQICASPQTLAHVVFEIQQRKRFKKEYTEYAQQMADRLETFRENEKLRRQRFLESYSQHFVLSLFPSFTDRIPHFVNMSHQSFDDDLCELSTQMLGDMSLWLPQLTTPPSSLVSLFANGVCQTDSTKQVLPVHHTDSVSVGIQYTPVSTNTTGSNTILHTISDNSVQTIGTDTMENECQTTFNGVDASIQTFNPITAEVGLQIELKFGTDEYIQTERDDICIDCSVQTTPTIVSDIGLQVVMSIDTNEECSQTVRQEVINNSSQTDLQSAAIVSACDDASSQTVITETGSNTAVLESGSQTTVLESGSNTILLESGSQTILIESLDNCVQTISTELSHNSSQTLTTPGHDRLIQTAPIDVTCIGLQTNIISSNINNSTQTVLPDYNTTSSQTSIDLSLPDTSTNPHGITERNTIEESITPSVVDRRMSESGFWPVHCTTASSYIETHSDVMETEPQTGPTNSMTDLEGQVVALKAAVSGLKTQLVLERESHKKQIVGVEKEIKHVQRSLGRDIEDQNPFTISVGSLKVGDTALFLQDGNSNFLALTIDGRIYYLNHTSAERFKYDMSSKAQAPLRSRKIIMGIVTEKLLVEVRKESNRLKVPVGQRLYKLSARETPLPTTVAI